MPIPSGDHRLASGHASQPPWWLDALPCNDQHDGGLGLTSSEARDALAIHGENRISARTSRSVLWQFTSRFKNPLILILLVASAVSALSGDPGNFGIIMAMVVLSVWLDFFQEHRANRAAEALRESVSLRASVRRDGHVVDVAVAELVPGDVIVLSAGDRVPADARLLEARDFFVNQALLTGEPYPVEKRPAHLSPDDTELQQASNAVFMGTTVISGSACARVAATGSRTALGDIAHSIVAQPAPTAFERSTQDFGLLIMRLTMALVLFVMLTNVLLHRPLLESFLFAVALAVGLTPELLPMVISVTLSRGAMRMARQRVIVKRLASIENLGSMDILCTDKTGTLTEACMRLERCVDGEGLSSERTLLLAHLNSAFESGLKSPLDDAILAYEGSVDVTGWEKVDEVPFDFERRRVSVLVERKRGDSVDSWLVVKGAPDDVLSLCANYEHDAGASSTVLDAAARQRLQGQCHDLERQGLRVLAIAWRTVASEQRHADVSDESTLTFVGFAAFIDPPKAGAAQAISQLARSGVAIKIVSGDSELVTQHLCGLLGIAVKGVLTGREIALMDDATLKARAPGTTLFCRVNPAQKSRIILALKARGHVVGYLGDGINDAPPLRAADVSLTVDSAVDVAKEVADMILLEHDLGVLHIGVQEGRRTYGNIMKYIMMGTSSNFGNMLSMAAASLVLPFLPMLPVQVLLNNMLYDLSEVAIPLDDVDASDMAAPRTLSVSFIQRFMWFFGLISSLFDGLTFFVLLRVLHADEMLFRTGWFIESLVTQVLVIFVIRTRGPAWASRPSKVLLASSLSIVMVAVMLPFSFLAPFFHFEAPPAVFFVWLVGLLLTYLLLVEGAKRFFYARVWHGQIDK